MVCRGKPLPGSGSARISCSLTLVGKTHKSIAALHCHQQSSCAGELNPSSAFNLMEWMPPLDGIAMCHVGYDQQQTGGIHVRG